MQLHIMCNYTSMCNSRMHASRCKSNGSRVDLELTYFPVNLELAKGKLNSCTYEVSHVRIIDMWGQEQEYVP